MTQQPLITFLVAVRNRPDKVVRALSSVPLESPDLEVVVVDDASTDNTADRVVAEFGDQVVLVRQSVQRGSGAARNAAAHVARAPWCFILDSDNELLPEGVDRARAALKAANVASGLIFLGTISRASGAPCGHKDIADGPIDYRDLLRRRLHGEYIPLVRRDALLSIGYDEMIGRECSGVLWFRIAREHGAAAYDTPVLLYDDTSEDRMTHPAVSLNHPAEAAVCHERMLEVFGDELRHLDADVWADHVAKAAFWKMLGGERRQALREVVRAMRASRSRPVLTAAAAVAAGPRLTRRVYAR